MTQNGHDPWPAGPCSPALERRICLSIKIPNGSFSGRNHYTQPSSFMAKPECHILVMCRIFSPSNSMT